MTDSTPSSSTDGINSMNQQQQQEMSIQMTVPQPVASESPPNLPCGDLIGSRDDYVKICVPLYYASIRGDWEAAEAILREQPKLVGYGITENYDTALHIAASAKSNKRVEIFVNKLVNRMEPKQLELENKSYNTALCLAAAMGNVEIAKAMMNKHPALLDSLGNQQMRPLYMASSFAQREMVKYLYDKSNNMTGWTHQNCSLVLDNCVEAGLYDVALKIVTDKEELAKRGIVLGILARKKISMFRGIPPIRRVINKMLAVICGKVEPPEEESDAMKLLRIIWKNIMKLPKDEISEILRGPADKVNEDEKPTSSEMDKEEVMQLHGTIPTGIANLLISGYNLIRGPTDPIIEEKATILNVKTPKYSSSVLFVATERGNTEFVVELIRQYPDLIWKVNDDNQSIFHVAVSHRRVDIYNLLHEIGTMKDMITTLKDKNGNTMLHLVAKKNQRYVQGGALLKWHHAVDWFKEVQAMVPRSCRVMKNKDGLIPSELFTMEYEALRCESRKSLKVTAGQSIVVAALVSTVAFTVAFSVPGGYNQDNGIPIFLHKRPFIVFLVLDVISLAFSSYSIFSFLVFYIQDYYGRRFLTSNLAIGLTSLCLSIMIMMVAFGVSFFDFYQNKLLWIPIVISLFVFIPIIAYAKFQYAVLEIIYYFTHVKKNKFKPKQLRLSYQNPKF